MFVMMFFKTQNVAQTIHLTMFIAHPYQCLILDHWGGTAQLFYLRNGVVWKKSLVTKAWSVSIFQRSCLCQRMASYGSIGNATPPGGGSGDSEEERDSIRTPLVLPKGRRGMRRQPASQVNTHLQGCLDGLLYLSSSHY